MARKVRKIQDSSSHDDAPEVVSHSASKADAKRSQKALHDFEAEEKARRKARNRERDQKLKERARATKGGKTDEKLKGVKFMDQELEGEDEGGSGEDEGDDADGLEARMLRAMRDAAEEVASGEGEDDDDDDDDDGDGDFRGFGQEMDSGDDMGSGSDSSFAQEDDDDAEMSLGESDPIDPEAPTDDEEMDEDEEDEEITPPQANIYKSGRKVDYLADDLFAAAFASQKSKSPPKKNIESTQQQTVRKRRRKSIARPKDLVIGGRAIRTLPKPSDPRSQATARSVPSTYARRFMDQSLAMKGRQALLKAKKKGWERRPANVGVMKYQGAPHGFARTTR